MRNSILNTDSYKLSHYLQDPPGTQVKYSYVESRGIDKDSTLYVEGENPVTVFFGLQGFLQEYLSKGFTYDEIHKAESVARAHGLPFNKGDWDYLYRTYQGRFPVKIKAVPEGSVVPVSNVLATIENEDENVPWLTAYIETALLRAIWYPTTVATNSYLIKKDIKEYMLKTAGHVEGIDFKLHDFGARGVSSYESAAIGGAAHLVNFLGTDTLAGIEYLTEYYKTYGEMTGFSIPAAEHSTVTIWNNESDAYENMINQFAGKDRLVAIVSDSYDIYNAIDNIYGDTLRDKVVNNGGTIVIRPDSGVPEEVVPKVILKLMANFGYTTNKKGYRVLPSYLRVIQGDGIDRQSIRRILSNMEYEGLSAENIAFGMGGALLQQVNRDTFKFAMKCSAAKVRGAWRDVYKDPVTSSDKVSKKGRLMLVHENGQYKTVREVVGSKNNVLRTVFKNGRIVKDEMETIKQIRKRAHSG